ncbi:hypothetical protein niasHT_033753 [Heterodera trifolii]|uniref:Uncharacterized protein n=1 Tax=Heterodera trifolii TaxID=157864 RepID=A0ABD2IC38_9BILA
MAKKTGTSEVTSVLPTVTNVHRCAMTKTELTVSAKTTNTIYRHQLPIVHDDHFRNNNNRDRRSFRQEDGKSKRRTDHSKNERPGEDRKFFFRSLGYESSACYFTDPIKSCHWQFHVFINTLIYENISDNF